MITARKNRSTYAALAVTIAVFIALIIFVSVMLNNAMNTSSEEALKAVRDNVVRAVISAYAYEGVYPDSIEYLKEHYKLVVDTSKYSIYYDKIADNLMPVIIVTKRDGGN
jgi:uncharacterized membrane protein SpoIIM required for sporulation